MVNIALNLVAASDLAWQERKAESFTVYARCTAAAASGSATAIQRVRRQDGGGISLGTAVAISGAAASPNMGYHSSPLVPS